MGVVTVRNLPEETHRALKVRAAQHGRSTEAEVLSILEDAVAETRSILEDAMRPAERVKLGSELAAFGKRFGGLDLDVSRDPAPAEPASFE